MPTLLFSRACVGELGILLGASLIGVFFPNLILISVTVFIFLFLVFFYRVPSFIVENLTKNVLQSPSTGKIIGIQKQKEGIKIFIFLSPLDPHVQFVPFDGVVRKIVRLKGPNEYARTLKEKKNRVITDIEIPTGEFITITQNTGLIARRIVNFLKPGEWVKKGDQLGLIKFGSRVDVLIPFSFQLKVVPGQRVKIGEILASQK